MLVPNSLLLEFSFFFLSFGCGYGGSNSTSSVQTNSEYSPRRKLARMENFGSDCDNLKAEKYRLRTSIFCSCCSVVYSDGMIVLVANLLYV